MGLPGSLQDAVATIETARRSPNAAADLAALLAEQSNLYRGRATSEAERLRGYVLAGFETVGLPAIALPCVLAELETGQNPYTVAAAARALAGCPDPPSEALHLLAQAARRMRRVDDLVSYETYDGVGGAGSRSAVAEIVRALASQGPSAAPYLRALQDDGGLSAGVTDELRQALATASRPAQSAGHCCGGAGADVASPPPATALADILVQDQSGATARFETLFGPTPSAIAFFYTRCMNPQKCSLTISKLAELKHRLRDVQLDHRVMVAAFTYDPDYDQPSQLAAYGAARGFPFDAHCRLLRTVGLFAPLQTHFALGVGYGDAIVNQHRIDLVVLDAGGRAVLAHAHRLWDVGEVFEVLGGLVPA